jgi:hypothetical protein
MQRVRTKDCFKPEPVRFEEDGKRQRMEKKSRGAD